MKQIINLDARKFTDKAASHVYLKEQFEFSEYYGNNLDALYDCLTELPETEIFIENVKEAGDYYLAVIDVMMEVTEENDGFTLVIMEKE